MELQIDQIPDHLDVLSFESRERMNGSYRVDVRVSCSTSSDLAARALERKAVLLVPGDASPRAFHGVVSRVRHEAPDARGKRPLLIRIEPTVRRLSRGSARHIFQDVTAVDVITRVLTSRAIAHRLALRSTYALRPYCTQYDESDWEFVTRLLADEGIAWWWEHPVAAPPGSETLVLDDSASPRPDIDGGARFTYREADGSVGMAPREADVTHFEVWTRARARAALRQGYDLASPLRPLLDARAVLVVSEPPMEPDGSSGMRGGLDPTLLAPPEVGAQTLAEPLLEVERCRTGDAAPGSATVRLEQARANVRVAHGESLSVRLSPGSRLDLSDHPDADANRSWTLTEVRTEGFSPSALPPGRAHRTHTTFACVPAEVRFRPRAPRRTPRQVTETAVVVGAEGQEIHTDHLGRVKVRFHWDPSLRHDDTASCWLRVTQMWAGAGWGAMFLPRVGMEVLVTYLGGDTDCPVVTGCLYNGTHPTWPKLPEERTRNGIRSQSTPGGGGYNELSFEDAATREQIFLHAQRDLDEVVERNHTLLVRSDEAIHVHGNRHDRIQRNLDLHVQNDFASRVDGNRLDVVMGAADQHVTGLLGVRLDAGERRDVRRDARLEYAEDLMTRVFGSAITLVGTSDQKRTWITRTEGITELSASDCVRLVSEKEVLLCVGKSTLRIGPDRIELSSPSVTISGDGGAMGVSADGLALKSKDAAQLALNQKVVLRTEDASVLLDHEVKLGGAKIQMNSGEKAKEQLAAQQKTPTKLELVDQDGNPLPHQRFLIKLSGEAIVGGVTDKDGKAEPEIDAAGDIVFPDLTMPGDQSAKGDLAPVVVMQGDYLAKLAFVHGFEPDEIWSDAKNKDLAKERTDPNVLAPGDVLRVPPKKQEGAPIHPQQSNRYQVHVPKVKVEIEFRDGDNPLGREPCEVHGIGKGAPTATDGGGKLALEVPVLVRDISVTFPKREGMLCRFHVGEMDPVSYGAGVAQRLRNLGYLPFHFDRDADREPEIVRNALRSFQSENALQPTGEPDEPTMKALLAAHVA